MRFGVWEVVSILTYSYSCFWSQIRILRLDCRFESVASGL
jgi:hypothetical protein